MRCRWAVMIDRVFLAAYRSLPRNSCLQSPFTSETLGSKDTPH